VPRAGLSREIVVAEAARVADEEGYERLTLAAVAKRFGVAVPSLYKHVHGLDALRRGLAVLAIRELSEALAAGANGREGKPALRAMAHAYRDYAREHPGRYAATLRAPDPSDRDATSAAQSLLATVFSVLAGYDLTGTGAVHATRALRAALHGFVALQAAGGFGMPQDVDRSFERMVDGLDAALRQWKQSKRKDGKR
jgi:AcrR family transcriptional regulator